MFEAFDGKRFETEEACHKHEKTLETFSKDIALFDRDRDPSPLRDDKLCDAEFIGIYTDEAAQYLAAKFDEMKLISPFDSIRESPREGFFYWDIIEGRWVDLEDKILDLDYLVAPFGVLKFEPDHLTD